VISTFISAVLGISIPISLSVISNVDTKYHLNVLTTSFVKEPIFLTLLYALFFNAFLLIFNLLGSNKIYEYSTFIISALSLIVLALYIQKIIIYSSSLKLKLDLLKKINKKIKKFIQNSKIKYLDEIIVINEQLCGIAINEIKNGDYTAAKNSLEQISKNFEQMIISNRADNDSLLIVCQHKTIIADESSESRTFLDTYLGSVYDFWKAAYIKERTDLTTIAVNKLRNTFLEVIIEEKYDIVINSILNTFSLIVNYSSKNVSSEIDSSVNRAAFYWFDSAFYKIEKNKKKLSLAFEDKYNTLQSYLWINLKILIKNNRFDLLQLYFRMVFNGYTLFISNNLHLGWRLKQLHTELERLVSESLNLEKFQDYQSWLKDCNNWTAMLESSVGTPIYGDYVYQIENFKDSALKCVFLHKQKEFVAALASMALYYKNYKFINDLWQYRQPDDTISVNGGNDILPNNLLEIFKIYIDSNNIPFGKYSLGNNHDIEIYIRRYAVLLFLRQYTRQSFYITDKFLEIDYIPSHLKHEDLHNWEHHLKQFKGLFSYIKKNTKLLEELKFDYQAIEEFRKPEEIIDELIELLQKQREINVKQSDLDNKVIEFFKENLFQNFKKQNFFYNACSSLGKVKYKEEKEYPNIEVSKCHELIERAPMSKVGDHVMHINYGGGYGRSMASSFNYEYYYKLKNCCKNSKPIIESSQEKLLNNLDQLSLGEEYVILSINVSFSYGIEDAESKFISINFLDEKLDHPSFEGNYDQTPVLTFHNQNLPKSLFIIHKDSLPEIFDYKFDHPDGLERIGNALYFIANDLNKQELLNKYKEKRNGSIGYTDEKIRKYVEICLENYSIINDANFNDGTMIIIKE
jgi:hypothetical protein